MNSELSKFLRLLLLNRLPSFQGAFGILNDGMCVHECLHHFPSELCLLHCRAYLCQKNSHDAALYQVRLLQRGLGGLRILREALGAFSRILSRSAAEIGVARLPMAI